MIRSLTYILALGTVVLCCGAAMADVPVAATPPAPPVVAISPSPGVPIAGLQAKIITVNPRLTHHKGRQLRVFVRNRGTLASVRGSIRLRARPGQRSTFETETRPLPAIAPGGEVSRSFSVPRHFRGLPSPNRLEAVVTLQGVEMVLPPFTNNHAAIRPALPVLPGPATNAPVPLK